MKTSDLDQLLKRIRVAIDELPAGINRSIVTEGVRLEPRELVNAVTAMLEPYWFVCSLEGEETCFIFKRK